MKVNLHILNELDGTWRLNLVLTLTLQLLCFSRDCTISRLKSGQALRTQLHNPGSNDKN